MNILEKTEKKVFSYLEENHMIIPGECVVVGVSGGADSVCLLFLLAEYRKQKNFDLHVVHIHHGIRKEADEDALFVEQMCEELGIPFSCHRIDVPQIAVEQKISTEVAGREARYRSFYQTAAEHNATKIVVAHNKNDNAETVLFHLFRGSGTGGLSGIAPVRKGEGDTTIIRPLLSLEREEIEAYLKERNIFWRVDATNQENEYTRNRIRHHILPFAEQEVAQGAVDHIVRSAQMLKETEDYLAEQTRKVLQQVARGQGRLEIAGLTAYPPLIQKRVLFAVAKEFSPTGKDISQIHVNDMMTLLEKKENRSIRLPFGIVVSRRYEEIVFDVSEEDLKEQSTLMEIVSCDSKEWELALPGIGRLEFRKFLFPEGAEIPNHLYTKWFDCDKIEQSIQIRYRREGDYLCIRDAKGELKHKTLKQYLIDEKIPKQERDKMPVLADGDHILWIIGKRISEFFKVTENTKTILEVKLINSDCETQ